jgi:hypothetical protein
LADSWIDPDNAILLSLDSLERASCLTLWSFAMPAPVSYKMKLHLATMFHFEKLDQCEIRA